MEAVKVSCGSLPAIIRNDHGLYEGDLIHYFKEVFHHAVNIRHPYHNFRHTGHVLFLCYEACEFYGRELLHKGQMRNLLIAALFHDFDHSGTFGHDDLNIERAIRGLKCCVLAEDKDYLFELNGLIRCTQYPYVVSVRDSDLAGKILRDADMGQSFSPAWIQQIVLGLAAEWNKDPLEILDMQISFLEKLEFRTDWAKQKFTPNEVGAKMVETKELIELLT